MDGDGPCDSGSKKANGGTGGDYQYYASSTSTSGGLHWSSPRPMHDAGCVRPKLLSLGPSAPVLLSGGRLCVENTTDIDVWVSEDGMAKPAAWTKHSVSYIGTICSGRATQAIASTPSGSTIRPFGKHWRWASQPAQPTSLPWYAPLTDLPVAAVHLDRSRRPTVGLPCLPEVQSARPTQEWWLGLQL